jgi:hypothetical protein
MAASLIAEAQFFRAFDYFMLVQTFGGVPLDLGAGELKFNSSSKRTSVRNTVPEVYTKAIFPDLNAAVENLPEKGRVTGGATKTLARLYLAKAYLTYGWWLQNPGNIPTYPEAARTDPDGHDATWYFQQAYNVASAAIDAPGDFGLQASFYDVNWAQNDRNNEILLYADHSATNESYNGGGFGYTTGSAPDNFAHWMIMWNYNMIKSATAADGSGSKSPIEREIIQDIGGRPWSAIAPVQEVFTNTFADKTNDSRYDGTFITVYRANWSKYGASPSTLYNANNLPVMLGNAVLTFLPDETLSTSINYPGGAKKGANNIGAGIIAGRADYVLTPSNIGRVVFPGLWKLGPRTGNSVTGFGDGGASSTRPFNIAKFSELYLVAAEAAVKLNNNTAAKDMVNVLRARAGKWRFSNANNAVKIENRSAALVAATPETIDINYILAERSREYFGECYRWYDLVRTQKWAELASTYTICETGADFEHVVPTTKSRTIKPTDYLRPIPNGQIEGMEMTAAEKAAYQNPGYN